MNGSGLSPTQNNPLGNNPSRVGFYFLSGPAAILVNKSCLVDGGVTIIFLYIENDRNSNIWQSGISESLYKKSSSIEGCLPSKGVFP